MKKTGSMITKMPNLILLQNCTSPSHIADKNKLDGLKKDITFGIVSVSENGAATIKVHIAYFDTPIPKNPTSLTRSIVGNRAADFGNRMFNKLGLGGRVSRRRHPKR